MPRQRLSKTKSNIKRCPLLKITKRIVNKDGSEEIMEEFNDCYQSFCMAWNDKDKCCTYFDLGKDEEEEEDEVE